MSKAEQMWSHTYPPYTGFTAFKGGSTMVLKSARKSKPMSTSKCFKNSTKGFKVLPNNG